MKNNTKLIYDSSWNTFHIDNRHYNMKVPIGYLLFIKTDKYYNCSYNFQQYIMNFNS